MRLLITTCLLLSAWFNLVAAGDYKVVCYFGSWAIYRPGNGKIDIPDLDPTLCTHMIYTFVGINDSGEVRVLDPWADLPDNGGRNGFGRFNDLRKLSPNMKTLVAIGGWNQGSTTFSKVTSDPSLRAKFVKNVVEFLQRFGFDGFDLDWEYPSQRGGASEDKANFVLLTKELRASFDPHKFILSAAVAAPERSAKLSYDIGEISKYLDFINLMAYDFHGSWDSTTGENAPLYASSREQTVAERSLNVNATVEYWLSQGASSKKLILGTGLYGRSFTLQSSSSNGIGAPSIGPGTEGPYTREKGMLGYNEICELQMKKSWTVKRDDEERVPYAFQNQQWVGYDDVKSITEKANYAKSMNLGGAMVWSMDTDDFRGICGEKYPLLKALNHVLRGGSSAVPASPKNPSSANPATPNLTTVPQGTPSSMQNRPIGAGNVQTKCTRAGHIRDASNCAKFWMCQQRGPNLEINGPFSCPEGLYFDTRYDTCNFKTAVSC